MTRAFAPVRLSRTHLGMAALLASTTLSSLTAPAYAQTAQSGADVDMLAPVKIEADAEQADGPVVGAFATRSATATKTDTPLIETPQAISVLSAESLEERGVSSVAEALRYSSGVTTENRGGSVTRYDMLTVRGFQVNREFLDGMQLQYNGWYAVPQIDPAMTERIEILKGPASVLYGNTPPGGLVNIVTKRPQFGADQGEVTVSTGTNDGYDATLDATGTLSEEDNVAYRLIARGTDEDGQAKTTEVQRVLIAPSLTWAPNERLSITFNGHYQHDPKSGSYGSAPVLGTLYTNPLGQLSPDFYDGDVNFEKFDRVQYAIGYMIDYDIDDIFTVRQNMRFLDVKIGYESIYPTALAADNRTLSRASIFSDERSKSWSVDNQLQAKFSTGAIEHTVLAGLDYYNLNSDVIIGYGTAPTLDLFNPDNDQGPITVAPSGVRDYDRSQTGIYLQEQLQWGGLTVLAGGRKDWYDRKDFDPIFSTTTTLNQDNFSGRVGALYHFDFGLAPFVSYSESFEPQSGSDFYGKPFDPTTGQATEAGLKYQNEDETVFAQVSAFRLYKQNVTTTDPAHPTFSIQTGEIRSEGVEAEVQLELFENLDVSAYYTWLDVEYTKDNTGLVGKTPVWVADQSASLWADYTFDGMLEGLKLGGGVRYTGEQYIDSANSGTTDPFTLFDALIEYDLGAVSDSLVGTSVRVNGTNITDKEHVAGCYSRAWCWFGEPREVSVTLAHKW